LLGLLAVTGLRYSEALSLHVADLDVDHAVLTIRGAKLGKTRLVPLHASTVQVLMDYLRRREAFSCRDASPFLLVNCRGKKLDQAQVHRTFYELSRAIGLRGEKARHGPRLHDFRHRFAVRVLTQWYRAGEDPQRRLPVLSAYLGHVRVAADVAARMPMLSTYLGHVHPANTYWYLSAWPELMTLAMSRLEQRWGSGS